MGAPSQYRYEQFIDQYEHIVKLDLLKSEELAQIKRKRNHHETLITNASDVRVFIDYIQYEIALMKKFHHLEYRNDNDRKILELEIAKHVKDLFRMALKRFRDKRQLWKMYISFAKQKFKNHITRIYEEMLHFHHKVNDFAEAAQYEIFIGNFQVAMNILMQGIAVNRTSNEILLLLYVECCAKSAEVNTAGVEGALVFAEKTYDKLLKPVNDVLIHCSLLEKIENAKFTKSFQNYILKHLKETYSNKAALWNLIASRHMKGLFDEDEESSGDCVETNKMPMQVCFKRGIETFERGLQTVDDDEKQKLYEMFINKLIEFDKIDDKSLEQKKIVRKALGKVLKDGFECDNLSSSHFLTLLRLKMINMKRNENEIWLMIEKGQILYPNSMELFEYAIKFNVLIKNYENVKQIFAVALTNNKKDAIELHKFLCKVYLARSQDKEIARQAMLEAINSSNNELSEAFQAFYIEFTALNDGIDKAKEIFHDLLSKKPLNSLSLDFFKVMIKLEEELEDPDEKLIKNCFERAVEHFGKDNSEIWIDYIRYLWKVNKHKEANDIRNRALIHLKKDYTNVERFERELIELRMSAGANVEI